MSTVSDLCFYENICSSAARVLSLGNLSVARRGLTIIAKGIGYLEKSEENRAFVSKVRNIFLELAIEYKQNGDMTNAQLCVFQFVGFQARQFKNLPNVSQIAKIEQIFQGVDLSFFKE